MSSVEHPMAVRKLYTDLSPLVVSQKWDLIAPHLAKYKSATCGPRAFLIARTTSGGQAWPSRGTVLPATYHGRPVTYWSRTICDDVDHNEWSYVYFFFCYQNNNITNNKKRNEQTFIMYISVHTTSFCITRFCGQLYTRSSPFLLVFFYIHIYIQKFTVLYRIMLNLVPECIYLYIINLFLFFT